MIKKFPLHKLITLPYVLLLFAIPIYYEFEWSKINWYYTFAGSISGLILEGVCFSFRKNLVKVSLQFRMIIIFLIVVLGKFRNLPQIMSLSFGIALGIILFQIGLQLYEGKIYLWGDLVENSNEVKKKPTQ